MVITRASRKTDRPISIVNSAIASVQCLPQVDGAHEKVFRDLDPRMTIGEPRENCCSVLVS